MGKKAEDLSCPNCLTSNPADSSYCSSCGTSLKESPRTKSYPEPIDQLTGDFVFPPGSFLGERYQIIERIGRGGMGSVYKAQDRELGILVALKIIRPDQAAKPWFIEQIKKETLLGRSIAHENVVRIFDIGEANQIKYISMEYIKGQSLKDLLRTSGSLAVETTINYCMQICRALSLAHRKKIIHRDLKPSNIMVDEEGRVQIMDFGIAVLTDEYAVRGKQKVVGTPAYLSPEQAEGKRLDHRSDIYNIGCLLFEMLTGAQPFCADSTEEYIEKHLHESPPPLSKVKSTVPNIFENIVLKCLAKDPNDRYQDCDEIIRDLETVRESIAPPLRYSIFQRFKRPVLIFVLPTALILLIYVWFRGGGGRSEAPALTRMTLSILPFQNKSGDESLDNYQWVFQEMMITDLENSQYLYVIPTIRLNALLTKINQDRDGPLTKEALDKIADSEGVEYFLQGHFIKLGEMIRFTIKVLKPYSYETASSLEIDCRGEDEIFDRIDELTIWVKSNLGFNRYEIVKDYDENIKKLTDSKPALQLFYRARRLYYQGDYKRSIQTLEEACQLDPEFAMAYRDISTNYAYLQDMQMSVRYAEKALELAEKGYGSERDRVLIRAHAFYTIDRAADKAIDIYKKLLETYPEDPDVHSRLAAIYRNLGEWDLAEQHFMKVQFWNPDITHSNLTWIYAQKGQYNKALDLLNSNKGLLNPIVYNRCMASTYLCLGDSDLALRHAAQIEKVFPDDLENIQLLGNIYQLAGDFRSARRYYSRLLESQGNVGVSTNRYFELMLEEGRFAACIQELNSHLQEYQKRNAIQSQMDLLMLLALVQYELGDYGGCQKTCARSLEVGDDLWIKMQAWHIGGIAHAKAGDITAAEQEAEKMRLLIEEQNLQRYSKRDYQHLLGIIALEKQEYQEAIATFHSIRASLEFQNSVFDHHAFFIDSLAHALYLHNDLDQAQKYYTEILNLTTGRLSWGSIYVRSFYWLGKIALQFGRREEAAEYFRRFLTLWQNADRDLPEIVDARDQLALFNRE